MSLVLPGAAEKSVAIVYRDRTTGTTRWTMGLLRALWTGCVPEEWCVAGRRAVRLVYNAANTAVPASTHAGNAKQLRLD